MKDGAFKGLFDEALLRSVAKRYPSLVKEGVLGSALTTMAVGGPVKALCSFDDEHQLCDVLEGLSAADQPVRVIGNGSNVVIGDGGLDEWVLRLGSGFRSIERLNTSEFQIGGATPLMSLARKLSDDGFSGLEFAAGIPASVGGAVFMNAGAHGTEIAERVVSVTVVNSQGNLHVIPSGELPWRYRSSGLQAGVLVVSVRLGLVPGDREKITWLCRKNLEHRRATQPLSLPSAGSFFKNPSSQIPAGRVLEQARLKGKICGGAMVSDLHANWIVNPKRQACYADIYTLMSLCQNAARKEAGVELEPEVKLWV